LLRWMEVRRCLSLLIEEEESTRPDEFQLKKLFAVRCSCLKIIRPVFFICHNTIFTATIQDIVVLLSGPCASTRGVGRLECRMQRRYDEYNEDILELQPK
jgi:hypothetical protein